MAKVTQKQLIDQIGMLKEIKPRKEWAVLLKSQIIAKPDLTESFGEARQAEVKIPAQKIGFIDILSSVFFQRKLVYSFAVALFLIVGIFGFAVNTMPGDLLFPIKKIAEQSQAALTGQTGLKNDIAVLSSSINDLVQATKDDRINNIPSAISEINANALILAKNLKNNPTQNRQTIRDIANSLKTLADVPGTDLMATPEVQDLYQIIVQSQIADLNKTTLTDDQKNMLAEAEDLYNQGKYTDALEKILLISK